MTRLMLIFMLASSKFVLAQTVSFGYGNSYVYSSKGSTMPKGANLFDDDNDYLKLQFDYPYKNWNLFVNFTHYKGRTTIAEQDYTQSFIFRNAIIYTYNFGIGRDLFWRYKYFTLLPFISLGLQQSIDEGYLIHGQKNFEGPEIFQVTDSKSKTESLVQLIPSFGLRTYWTFGTSISLGIDAQLSRGFVTYQSVWFDYYDIEDIHQTKTAKFETKGTGYFICPFIEIKIGNQKKSTTEEARIPKNF